MTKQKVLVPIKRLDTALDIPLPIYHSDGAVGVDLHAAVAEDLLLNPGTIASVPCGFAVAIPEGYEGQVRPRSGLSGQHGVTVINSPGTIDSDYRGEVKVLLINLGSTGLIINRGMRIAQLLVLPVPQIEWKE